MSKGLAVMVFFLAAMIAMWDLYTPPNLSIQVNGKLYTKTCIASMADFSSTAMKMFKDPNYGPDSVALEQFNKERLNGSKKDWRTWMDEHDAKVKKQWEDSIVDAEKKARIKAHSLYFDCAGQLEDR